MKEKIEKFVFNYKSKEFKKADIALVFGGYKMIPERVNGALKLYQDKLIKKILVTGKSNYFKIKPNISEARLMAKYLQEHGVSKEDIIIEEKSRSTYKNIELSQKILEEMNLGNIAIVLVSSEFHLKRCLLVAKNYFKNLYVYPILDKVSDKNCWQTNRIGRKIILREAFLLWYYKLTNKIKN